MSVRENWTRLCPLCLAKSNLSNNNFLGPDPLELIFLCRLSSWRFRQVSRQNASHPQGLVPHEWGGTTVSGGLTRNLTEPIAVHLAGFRHKLLFGKALVHKSRWGQ